MTETPKQYLDYCRETDNCVNLGYYVYLVEIERKYKLSDYERELLLYNLQMKKQRY